MRWDADDMPVAMPKLRDALSMGPLTRTVRDLSDATEYTLEGQV